MSFPEFDDTTSGMGGTWGAPPPSDDDGNSWGTPPPDDGGGHDSTTSFGTPDYGQTDSGPSDSTTSFGQPDETQKKKNATTDFGNPDPTTPGLTSDYQSYTPPDSTTSFGSPDAGGYSDYVSPADYNDYYGGGDDPGPYPPISQMEREADARNNSQGLDAVADDQSNLNQRWPDQTDAGRFGDPVVKARAQGQMADAYATDENNARQSMPNMGEGYGLTYTSPAQYDDYFPGKLEQRQAYGGPPTPDEDLVNGVRPQNDVRLGNPPYDLNSLELQAQLRAAGMMPGPGDGSGEFNPDVPLDTSQIRPPGQVMKTASGQTLVLDDDGSGYGTWKIPGADNPDAVLYRDERFGWQAISRSDAQWLVDHGATPDKFTSVSNAPGIVAEAINSTGTLRTGRPEPRPLMDQGGGNSADMNLADAQYGSDLQTPEQRQDATTSFGHPEYTNRAELNVPNSGETPDESKQVSDAYLPIFETQHQISNETRQMSDSLNGEWDNLDKRWQDYADAVNSGTQDRDPQFEASMDGELRDLRARTDAFKSRPDTYYDDRFTPLQQNLDTVRGQVNDAIQGRANTSALNDMAGYDQAGEYKQNGAVNQATRDALVNLDATALSPQQRLQQPGQDELAKVQQQYGTIDNPRAYYQVQGADGIYAGQWIPVGNDPQQLAEVQQRANLAKNDPQNIRVVSASTFGVAGPPDATTVPTTHVEDLGNIAKVAGVASLVALPFAIVGAGAIPAIPAGIGITGSLGTVAGSYLLKGTGEHLGDTVHGGFGGVLDLVGGATGLTKVTDAIKNMPIPEAAQNPLSTIEQMGQYILENPGRRLNPVYLAADIYKNGIAEGGLKQAYNQNDQQFGLSSGLQKAGLEYLATSAVQFNIGLAKDTVNDILSGRRPSAGIGDFIRIANPVGDYTNIFQGNIEGGMTPEQAAQDAFTRTNNGVASLIRTLDLFNPYMYAVEVPFFEDAVRGIFKVAGVGVRGFLDSGATGAVGDIAQGALGNAINPRGAFVATRAGLDLFTTLSTTSAVNIANEAISKEMFTQIGRIGEKNGALADLYEMYLYKSNPEVWAQRITDYSNTYLKGQEATIKALSERLGAGFTQRMIEGGAKPNDIPGMIETFANTLRSGDWASTPELRAASDATARKYVIRPAEIAKRNDYTAFELAKADVLASLMRQSGLPVIPDRNAAMSLLQAGANSLRSLYLLPGASALAIKKIGDEFIRGGLTGVWGLRPADFQLVRTGASRLIERGGALGAIGQRIEDRSVVRQAMATGTPIDDYLLRTPMSRYNLGDAFGRNPIDNTGRKVTAMGRLEALFGAPGRFADKYLQTLVSSPTQHLRLSGAYRELKDVPAIVRSFADELMTGLVRDRGLPQNLAGLIRTDLARATNQQDYYEIAQGIRLMDRATSQPSVPTNAYAKGRAALPTPEGKRLPLDANGKAPLPRDINPEKYPPGPAWVPEQPGVAAKQALAEQAAKPAATPTPGGTLSTLKIPMGPDVTPQTFAAYESAVRALSPEDFARLLKSDQGYIRSSGLQSSYASATGKKLSSADADALIARINAQPPAGSTPLDATTGTIGARIQQLGEEAASGSAPLAEAADGGMGRAASQSRAPRGDLIRQSGIPGEGGGNASARQLARERGNQFADVGGAAAGRRDFYSPVPNARDVNDVATMGAAVMHMGYSEPAAWEAEMRRFLGKDFGTDIVNNYDARQLYRESENKLQDMAKLAAKLSPEARAYLDSIVRTGAPEEATLGVFEPTTEEGRAFLRGADVVKSKAPRTDSRLPSATAKGRTAGGPPSDMRGYRSELQQRYASVPEFGDVATRNGSHYTPKGERRSAAQAANDARSRPASDTLFNDLKQPGGVAQRLEWLRNGVPGDTNEAYIARLKSFGTATGREQSGIRQNLADVTKGSKREADLLRKQQELARFREDLAELRALTDPSYNTKEAQSARQRIDARNAALDEEMRRSEESATEQLGYNPFDGVSAYDQVMTGWERQGQPRPELTRAGGPQPVQTSPWAARAIDRGMAQQERDTAMLAAYDPTVIQSRPPFLGTERGATTGAAPGTGAGSTTGNAGGLPPFMRGPGYPRMPQPPTGNPDYQGAADDIEKQGRLFAQMQLGRGNAALERGNAIVGNFRQQTPIGELMTQGTINGRGPNIALVPFAPFHIHTTQYWAEYFLQHPQAAYAIANALNQYKFDEYGGKQVGNQYVSGMLDMSTAAHLIHWAQGIYDYAREVAATPGNNPLQKAAKIGGQALFGNEAYVRPFDYVATPAQAVLQSTTNPLIQRDKNGQPKIDPETGKPMVDKREQIAEQGSATGPTGLLQYLNDKVDVGQPWAQTRNIISGVTNPGQVITNKIRSGAVNAVDRMGGNADLSSYQADKQLPYFAGDYAQRNGLDPATVERALYAPKSKEDERLGSQIRFEYARQQDQNAIGKLLPVHASEETNAKGIFPPFDKNGPVSYSPGGASGRPDFYVNRAEFPDSLGFDIQQSATAKEMLKSSDPAVKGSAESYYNANQGKAYEYNQRAGTGGRDLGVGQPAGSYVEDKATGVLNGYNVQPMDQARAQTAYRDVLASSPVSPESVPGMDYNRQYLGNADVAANLSAKEQSTLGNVIEGNAKRTGATLPPDQRAAQIGKEQDLQQQVGTNPDGSPFTLGDLLKNSGLYDAKGAQATAIKAELSRTNPIAAAYLAKEDAAFRVTQAAKETGGMTPAEKNAFDAFNDLRNSADYKRYQELEAADRAAGAYGTPGEKAWYAQNKDELNRLKGVVATAEQSIQDRFGVNPKEIANRASVAAGRSPVYADTTLTKQPGSSSATSGSAGSSSLAGLSPAEQQALDSFNTLRDSTEYKRYQELQNQERAAGAYGTPGEKAWYEKNKTELNKLKDFVEGTEAAIAQKFGANPKEAANKVAVAAGRQPTYANTEIKGATSATSASTGGADGGVRAQIVAKAMEAIGTDDFANFCEQYVEQAVEAITGRRGATGQREPSASVGYQHAVAQGLGISEDEAQAGDLVYYPDAAGGVGHVAVYMGNGQQVSTLDVGGSKVHVEGILSGARFVKVPGLADAPDGVALPASYARAANASSGYSGSSNYSGSSRSGSSGYSTSSGSSGKNSSGQAASSGNAGNDFYNLYRTITDKQEKAVVLGALDRAGVNPIGQKGVSEQTFQRAIDVASNALDQKRTGGNQAASSSRYAATSGGSAPASSGYTPGTYAPRAATTYRGDNGALSDAQILAGVPQQIARQIAAGQIPAGLIQRAIANASGQNGGGYASDLASRYGTTPASTKSATSTTPAAASANVPKGYYRDKNGVIRPSKFAT